MSIEVTRNGTRVWSDHPEAKEEVAEVVWGVFNKYWMEGVSEDERLCTEIDHPSGNTVNYYIQKVKPN